MSSCVKCFYLKTRCSKKYIAFAHVELNILLILTYCLLVVFAPCLKSKFITFVTVTELITVPFGEISHTTCVLYFFDSRSWKKNCYLTDFFITRFQHGNCQLMWRDSIPIDNSCSVYNLYFCFSLLFWELYWIDTWPYSMQIGMPQRLHQEIPRSWLFSHGQWPL